MILCSGLNDSIVGGHHRTRFEYFSYCFGRTQECPRVMILCSEHHVSIDDGYHSTRFWSSESSFRIFFVWPWRLVTVSTSRHFVHWAKRFWHSPGSLSDFHHIWQAMTTRHYTLVFLSTFSVCSVLQETSFSHLSPIASRMSRVNTTIFVSLYSLCYSCLHFFLPFTCSF